MGRKNCRSAQFWRAERRPTGSKRDSTLLPRAKSVAMPRARADKKVTAALTDTVAIADRRNGAGRPKTAHWTRTLGSCPQ